MQWKWEQKWKWEWERQFDSECNKNRAIALHDTVTSSSLLFPHSFLFRAFIRWHFRIVCAFHFFYTFNRLYVVSFFIENIVCEYSDSFRTNSKVRNVARPMTQGKLNCEFSQLLCMLTHLNAVHIFIFFLHLIFVDLI